MNDQTVRGVVYVMTNESMPGLVKIGMTTRGSIRRAEELYQTGVPTPFKVAAEFRSVNCRELEAMVHEALIEHRVSNSREFFRISLEDACECIFHFEDHQFYTWLEFMRPGHTITPDDHLFDPGDLARISHFCGVDELTCMRAMHELMPEDLEPAIERLRQRVGNPDLGKIAQVH